MLRKYIKRLGFHKVSVHTLRHTFGVNYVIKGTSQETIGGVMGFKDVRSTSKYISLARELATNEL